MVKVLVIGGTGHIGSYLIPRLWDRGYEVISISRGTAKPYWYHPAWKSIQTIHVDRKADEADGKFGQRVADVGADIVVDLMAYDLEQAKQVVNAIKGKVDHYLFCSTIWVYGPLTTIPADETQATFPIDEYGTKKLEIEQWLNAFVKREGFPATTFRPGHIVGVGWQPINPQGNLDPSIFNTIAAGGEISLPNLGLETLHHVHADDVALWVMCAIDNRSASLGECFNVVSPGALTLRGYSEATYRYFGQEPRLTYAPLEEWKKAVDDQWVGATVSHVTHSPCQSIEKSRKRLGWEPRYSSLEACIESIRALVTAGKITVP